MTTPQASLHHQPLTAPAAVDLAAWLARRAPAAPAGSPDRPRLGDRPAIAGRAAAYLVKLPPAVSGQRGHGRAFHAACVLVKGFGLSVDQARPVLEEWNRTCLPPWSAAELEHKLKSADAAPDDRPRGYLAGEARDPRRRRRGGRRPPVDPVAATPACDPTTGRPWLASSGCEANPHRLALVYLAGRHRRAEGVTLRYWRGEFHEWIGGAYQIVPTLELRARVAQCLADEFRRIHEASGSDADTDADDQGRGNRLSGPIPVSQRLVGDVLQALSGLVLLPADRCNAQPAWIDATPDSLASDPRWGRPEADDDEPDRAFADSACDLSAWPAVELIPARNAVVHPFSYVTGARCMTAPTPRFFNAHALNYDFNPLAPAPRSWLEFLRQVWPDDPSNVACLQEWFGYLLAADTRLQKILMVIGPPRSGKGTIGRVLKALAGASNVVNPGLSSLARSFGASMLIGKPIAVFSDVRLSKFTDKAAIVESLLSISGEDDQSIDRKHRSAWTGRLPTRFVFVSNELPNLRDSSGALSSRLVILRCQQSFAGREDTRLFETLKWELPGILLWAFEGWERLRRRGRFIQPDSARDLLAAMDAMSSPVASFLDERCVLEHDAVVATRNLFDAWRDWCRDHGRDAVGEESSLGASLYAAVPGLAKIRRRVGAERPFFYKGVRLRTPCDIDGDQG